MQIVMYQKLLMMAAAESRSRDYKKAVADFGELISKEIGRLVIG